MTDYMVPVTAEHGFTEWRVTRLCPNNATCVEVSWWRKPEQPDEPGMIVVRDSTDPDGPVLEFSPDEWDAFIGGVKAGEFDQP